MKKELGPNSDYNMRTHLAKYRGSKKTRCGIGYSIYAKPILSESLDQVTCHFCKRSVEIEERNLRIAEARRKRAVYE